MHGRPLIGTIIKPSIGLTAEQTAGMVDDLCSAGIDFLKDDELIGELVDGKLVYYPTTTREESPKMGRITTLIESGEVFRDIGIPPLDPAVDRAMVCGSLAFNLDIKSLLERAGLREGANSDPAEFVVEKAFVGDGI